MNAALLNTPLARWHEQHGGRMVDFAGWSMPVHYGSIVAEHLATRRGMTLFDVSHMGRLFFSSALAVDRLEPLTTRRTLDQAAGQVRYSLVCQERGGVLDDILVYRLARSHESPVTIWVVNASNRQKIVEWLADHVNLSELAFEDRTDQTAMMAVQGPEAIASIQPLIEFDVNAMKYYQCAWTRVAGCEVILSRTGYTGEDGVELIAKAEDASAVWEACLAASPNAQAAGLGARDTLRLEAGMPLYGHELHESINPLQAGLQFAVSLKDREFIGRGALAAYRADPRGPVRVGPRGTGKRAPREQYRLFQGDRDVGEITSGSLSPTLGAPLAMAYVEPDLAEVGTALEVDLRGSRSPLEVVPLPFYRR